MFIVKSVLLVALIGFATAEVTEFEPCPTNECTIPQVRVDPCTTDIPNGPCKISRRSPATMEFDFITTFDAATLESTLHWVTPTGIELPLISMDRDACKSTKCPIKSGEQQTYKVNIPMESKFPLNTYTIKWNFKAPSGNKCCFTHTIKLVR